MTKKSDTDRTATIRALNDQFRTTLMGGAVLMSKRVPRTTIWVAFYA